MSNTYKFLTYSDIVDNEWHRGVSIDIDGLTLENIKEAIERQKWLKYHDVEIYENDLLEIKSKREWERKFRAKLNEK